MAEIISSLRLYVYFYGISMR